MKFRYVVVMINQSKYQLGSFFKRLAVIFVITLSANKPPVIAVILVAFLSDYCPPLGIMIRTALKARNVCAYQLRKNSIVQLLPEVSFCNLNPFLFDCPSLHRFE